MRFPKLTTRQIRAKAKMFIESNPGTNWTIEAYIEAYKKKMK